MTTIQILGSGCQKCASLQKNVEAVLEETGLEANVQKIEDVNDIVEFGVMMTPALAIDGAVKFAGKIPTLEEIKAVLSH